MSFSFVLRYGKTQAGARVVAHRTLRRISSASAKFEEEVTSRIKDITDPATDRSIASIGILQVFFYYLDIFLLLMSML